MSQSRRNPPGGYIYHVLNRANRRAVLFEADNDYEAFLDVMCESLIKVPLRIIEFCLMPTHWHFLPWPEFDDQLAEFMHYATTTHAARWNRFRGLQGTGHVYQGPYKYFPTMNDEHYYGVNRYVVRNAQRAGLVQRAENWKWSSLHARTYDTRWQAILADPPLPYPANWIEYVNQPQTEAELAAIRRSIQYDYPYGSASWTERVAREFGFTNEPGQRGRPRP